MPSAPRPSRRWRSLGRCLPRDVRERIFEPAFSDLLRKRLSPAADVSRVPFGVHVVGTFIGCLPIAVPRLFLHRGRLTRLGRVAVWSFFALAGLVVVFTQFIAPRLTYA